MILNYLWEPVARQFVDYGVHQDPPDMPPPHCCEDLEVVRVEDSEAKMTPFTGAPTIEEIDRFNRCLLEMIVEGMLPFDVVENRGLQNLIKLLSPRYTLPTRKTIECTLIPELYESIKSKVSKLISNAKHVAVAIDIWTYTNTDPYVTTTVHFIDANIHYRSFVITTKKLIPNYTAKYLSEVLLDIFQSWKIQTKISVIVADSKAIIKAAIHLLGIESIPCTAHSLNNIINNSLRLDVNENDPLADVNLHQTQIINLVKLCRSIAKYFKFNKVSKRLLTEKLKQINSTVLRLKLDDSSKWNSTLVMMECFLKIKKPLTSVSLSILRCPQMPTTEQWIIMEDLVLLLKPFEMLTMQLTEEHRPTLGNIIPLIRGLLLSMDNKIPKTSSGIFLKKTLICNVMKVFGSVEQMQPSYYYAKATILDPRFKKAAFTSSSQSDNVEQHVLHEVTDLLNNKKECDTAKIDIATTGQQTAVPTDFTNGTENLLDYLQAKVATIWSQTSCTNTTAVTLIRQYMDLTYLNLLEDPIQFWKTHNSLLGPLSEVALKYACIPVSSVPSEIIFSNAGKVESQRRNKLSSKNIDVMIFLSKNVGK